MIALIGFGALPRDAQAQQRTDFKIAWSTYVGWMPWGYIEERGILDRWAARYGVTIDLVHVGDYGASLERYAAGEFDGVSATNMDALSFAGSNGVDTTAIIAGDFSNGNDAIILKGSDDLATAKGEDIHLVKFSVSHYLLVRCLEKVNLTESDVTVVDTPDFEIPATFQQPNVYGATTWNPIIAALLSNPSAQIACDSSEIPGEIIDMMVVNTGALRSNPNLGHALVGAWYEAMSIMAADDEQGQDARRQMATRAEVGIDEFQSQLDTTRMFFEPREAVEFMYSPASRRIMENVRRFLYIHELLGDDIERIDDIGIELANGDYIGNPTKLMLRFDPSYTDALTRTR